MAIRYRCLPSDARCQAACAPIHEVRDELSEQLPSLDEALELVNSKSWYHTFELRPGLFTPGLSEFPAAAILDEVGVAKDLSGLRALDVGTWDGPLAFELERRGARVTAVDIQDPDNTGFNVAKRILGSEAEYVQATVYDLPDVLSDRFDVVAFRGVYYHLKYPLLGFEKVAEVMADDGLLYFAGECLLHYGENLDGTASDLDIEAIAKSETPLSLCCPGLFKGGGNWAIPNFACVRSWLQSSGLSLVTHVFHSEPDAEPHPAQRIAGLAQKVTSELLEEHPVLEDGWREQWGAGSP